MFDTPARYTGLFSSQDKFPKLIYMLMSSSRSSRADSEANGREILCGRRGKTVNLITAGRVSEVFVFNLSASLIDFHGRHLSGPTSLQRREVCHETIHKKLQ